MNPGVKINGKYYRETLLKEDLLPDRHDISEYFIFQQDSAPAHRAKETVDLLSTKTPPFIPPTLWPPNSPKPPQGSSRGPLETTVMTVYLMSPTSAVKRVATSSAAVQTEITTWQTVSRPRACNRELAIVRCVIVKKTTKLLQ